MAEQRDDKTAENNDTVKDLFGVKQGDKGDSKESQPPIGDEDVPSDPELDVSNDSTGDGEDANADVDADESTEAILENRAHRMIAAADNGGEIPGHRELEVALESRDGDNEEMNKIMENMRQVLEGRGGGMHMGQEPSTYPPNVELQLRSLNDMRNVWRTKIASLDIPSPMDEYAVDKYNHEKSICEAEAKVFFKQIVAVAVRHNPAYTYDEKEEPEVVISRIMADVRPPQRVVIRTVLTGRGNVMKT